MAASNIDTSNGHYTGPRFNTKTDLILTQLRIVLQGDLVLPTDLTQYDAFKILTVDEFGRISTQDQTTFSRGSSNLQDVTVVGNVTSLPIQQAPATNNSELVTKGQMLDELQAFLNGSPELITIIEELITLIDNNDPSIQAIFDALALKVDKTQLGVDVQELTIQGGENRLPLEQAPLLTLEDICNNGQIATTQITGVQATEDDHLVTLLQVISLIDDINASGLHQVLGVGNESDREILLLTSTPDSFTNTLSIYGSSVRSGLGAGSSYNITNYYSNTQLFTHYYDLETSQSSLAVSQSSNGTIDPVWKDRLTAQAQSQIGLILTSLDMGHNPTLGLPIDADLLDGKHGDEYITKVEFPLNIVSPQTNDILVFDGINWVQGQFAGSAILNYFAESLPIPTVSAFAPKTITNSLHLKSHNNTNTNLGQTYLLGSGTNNFGLFISSTPLTINGSSNMAFGSYGYISGNGNISMASTNVESLANNNIIFKSSSIIGDGLKAVSNNLIAFLTVDSGSPTTFLGSDSVLLQNSNISFSQEASVAMNSFIANTADSTIQSPHVTALTTLNSLIRGVYATAIGTQNVDINADQAFVSGVGHVVYSYGAVQFGNYSTIEPGAPNSTANSINNRQLTIGSGTSSLRKNALNLWKSGQMELSGALKIGYDSTNETGAPIEGMLRWESVGKEIEVYKNNAWTPLSGGGSGLTSDQLAAINGAYSPSATNVFLTAWDLNKIQIHTQRMSVLDSIKSIAELFPPVTIVNQEMDMCIPASVPGVPEVTGTPISIVSIDLITHEIEVDFFPYFDGEISNEQGWLISKSVGTEPSRSGQDQQYAYITAFQRNGRGGILTYDPVKIRNMGSWTVGTTIYYTNITREWDYNFGNSTFKITNNPQVGSWTKTTIGQAGFFKTKSGELRLAVNGYNSTLQQRSVGIAMPVDPNDLTGNWVLDSSPRIPYGDSPAYCKGVQEGIWLTSIVKSPSEDCFIGYFNTYNSPREIGWVKFNEDMSWYEFGQTPMITAVGEGQYNPSIIFYNGKYHMLLAELNADTSPDAGQWTIGHYESESPIDNWTRVRDVDVAIHRDVKDCYRSSHSTECGVFIHQGKLCSFIDGTSRWNAAGNRGQRNIGLMFYDDTNEVWLPYRVGPVFAGYQFADVIWNLPHGHTGAIPSLAIDGDYLYFATQLTQAADSYKIVISRKLIK